MRSNAFVTCYVFRENGSDIEYLQILRCPGVYMAETWQPVAGAIEPDETAWEAALRELREETGMVPERFWRLPSAHAFYIPGNDTLNHAINFCCKVDADDSVVLNHEHTAFRWIARDAAHTHFMWPSDRIALQEIEQFILSSDLCSPYLEIPSPSH